MKPTKTERIERAWKIRLYFLLIITVLLGYTLIEGGIIKLENRVTNLENQLETLTKKNLTTLNFTTTKPIQEVAP